MSQTAHLVGAFSRRCIGMAVNLHPTKTHFGIPACAGTGAAPVNGACPECGRRYKTNNNGMLASHKHAAQMARNAKVNARVGTDNSAEANEARRVANLNARVVTARRRVVQFTEWAELPGMPSTFAADQAEAVAKLAAAEAELAAEAGQ